MINADELSELPEHFRRNSEFFCCLAFQLDPFEIRRRELIREKEIAAEVERKLADLLPKKLEEEIELRKEKIRMDLRLEMEEQIRTENDDLARINLELREVRNSARRRLTGTSGTEQQCTKLSVLGRKPEAHTRQEALR